MFTSGLVSIMQWNGASSSLLCFDIDWIGVKICSSLLLIESSPRLGDLEESETLAISRGVWGVAEWISSCCGSQATVNWQLQQLFGTMTQSNTRLASCGVGASKSQSAYEIQILEINILLLYDVTKQCLQEPQDCTMCVIYFATCAYITHGAPIELNKRASERASEWGVEFNLMQINHLELVTQRQLFERVWALSNLSRWFLPFRLCV